MALSDYYRSALETHVGADDSGRPDAGKGGPTPSHNDPTDEHYNGPRFFGYATTFAGETLTTHTNDLDKIGRWYQGMKNDAKVRYVEYYDFRQSTNESAASYTRPGEVHIPVTDVIITPGHAEEVTEVVEEHSGGLALGLLGGLGLLGLFGLKKKRRRGI